LKIVRGDLVEQEVEVIVSSDNFELTMSSGVSEAIRVAGGDAIAAEALRYIPVRPGRAVVTSAGSLPARFVFHAITNGATTDIHAASEAAFQNPEQADEIIHDVFDQWVLPSRDLISELLASCFYHADSCHVQTIAFPLLGAGGAGFSREVCLDTMFRFLARTLLRGLTSVREARIVLFK